MKEVCIYVESVGKTLKGRKFTGCGAVLSYRGNRSEIEDAVEGECIEKLALKSVVCALEKLRERCDVKVFHSSKLLMSAFKYKWLYKWQNNGWNMLGNCKNFREEFQRISDLLSTHNIRFIYVENPIDVPGCDYCTIIATKAIGGLVNPSMSNDNYAHGVYK